jgi:hypothetical protein
LKVIIDFDGTLTVEESQAQPLSMRSLASLANEILKAPGEQLQIEYEATKAEILARPYAYWWEVNGLIASYGNEGAFILNTTTLQVMLQANEAYCRAVAAAYPNAQYDPIVDCTNDLFHRHTAEFQPAFRPPARAVLKQLIEHENRTPIILTNSLGDKVRRHLAALALGTDIAVLGDTRQYEMVPSWPQRFLHDSLGEIQVWPVAEQYRVDLRRPDYHRALMAAASDGESIVVVADTFSMPGALPLLMGIPFFLLRTWYTPAWCIQAVNAHPLGTVLDDLADLPAALDTL